MTVSAIEAEQAVLGSILIDSRVMAEVMPALRAEDFGNEVNREIYLACLALYADGKALDPVTVLERTRENRCEVQSQYMLTLMDITPTAANVMEYVPIVRRHALRRGILELAEQVRKDANEGADPQDMLNHLLEQAAALEQEGSTKTLLDPTDLALRWYEHREKIDSGTSTYKISTGISALDIVLGDGYGQGGHHVISARPGNGKTTLALNIAENVAARYGPVLYINIEMSDVEIMAKRIARESGIDGKILLSKAMTDDQYAKQAAATDKILARPLIINAKSSVSVQDIAALARQIRNLTMIVVDYIELVTPSKETRRADRHEQLGAISAALKMLARKMNVPVITLCQISREIEKRADKRPNLADLRGSGRIEQDADSVTFLYRKEYFGNAQDKEPNSPIEVEFTVEKNRMGATGTGKLAFFPTTSKFISATSDPREMYRAAIRTGNI